MKLIFLDIDGVLNTDRYIRIQKNHNNGQITFDPEAMKNLKLLVEMTDSFIVICSTWRIHYESNEKLWRDLIRNFIEYLIDERIIGITPVHDKNSNTSIRWKEIEDWLSKNEDKGIESFVILDDEWDMAIYSRRFVRCQAYKGLTDDLRTKAEIILNT
ncbi:hypothetical protein D7Z26_00130 [Cohnella endophytica]|uniref:FCP1 homology domain-containing protein n=1 Tax=Cohnella endophytica TaxID=2419778 RepID=A0A494YCE9_9BACL|nr:HAD domain-containing protein [Cohnella endophytica]RKP57961.1 hypothetical protein D7Z26_00130 [Cohnella endophytica]